MIDRYLQSFIRVAETQEGFGVALTMNGVLVTGYVISRDDYLQGITDSAMSSATGERIEGEPLDRVKELFGIEETDESEDLPTYVHLKEAKILLGGFGGRIHHGWWRGRLDSVDGFSTEMVDMQSYR